MAKLQTTVTKCKIEKLEDDLKNNTKVVAAKLNEVIEFLQTHTFVTAKAVESES